MKYSIKAFCFFLVLYFAVGIFGALTISIIPLWLWLISWITSLLAWIIVPEILEKREKNK